MLSKMAFAADCQGCEAEQIRTSTKSTCSPRVIRTFFSDANSSSRHRRPAWLAESLSTHRGQRRREWLAHSVRANAPITSDLADGTSREVG